MRQNRGFGSASEGNMGYAKVRGARACLLVVGVVAVLGAGCSKTGSTTTTTTFTPPATSIDGWTAASLPDPVSATNALLSGVSCSSDASCTAVGGYGKSSGQFFSLAEHWNGSTWSAEAAAPALTSVPSRLLAISCPAATSCYAVGNSTITTNSQTALAEGWNGTTWSVVRLPIPNRALASTLTAISCSSPSACTAVGIYKTPPLGQPEVLLERWNGVRWVLEKAPPPSKHVTSITLSQVSCSSLKACTAVGQSTTSSGATALAEHWNGATWVTQVLPVLKGHRSSKLAGVSCASPDDCQAVGDTIDAAGTDVSLAEHWNGRQWMLESIAALPHTVLALSAVACPRATSCAAVGRGSIAIYSASAWKVQVAPAPPNTQASTFSASSDVSCPSSVVCVAVGVSVSGNGAATILVITKS